MTGMSCCDYRFCCLLFSTILIVGSFDLRVETFLLSDQFHLGFLIQVLGNCIQVRIIISVAQSQSIVVLAVSRIKTELLLLLSVHDSVSVGTEFLDFCFMVYGCCYSKYNILFYSFARFRPLHQILISSVFFDLRNQGNIHVLWQIVQILSSIDFF